MAKATAGPWSFGIEPKQSPIKYAGETEQAVYGQAELDAAEEAAELRRQVKKVAAKMEEANGPHEIEPTEQTTHEQPYIAYDHVGEAIPETPSPAEYSVYLKSLLDLTFPPDLPQFRANNRAMAELAFKGADRVTRESITASMGGGNA